MNSSTFSKKIISVGTLLFFIGTPITAFAQVNNNGFGQGLLMGNLLSQQGDAQGQNSLNNPLMMAMMMGGGGLGGFGGGAGGNGGAGGGGAQIGQFLTMAGLLSGNMGLAMAGMLTSMLGGLSGLGGAGATPQQGQGDEQYVGQGHGFPSGGSGSNTPFYPTPTPAATASACSQSVFIVNDTTVTPAEVKPYPTTLSISANDCVLALNADTASHNVVAKKQGDSNVIATEGIAGKASQIFRFPNKNTYTLCLDATTACSTVTVQ